MAEFCVMPPGMRDPSIEKLGAELVSAAEALEAEEREYLNRRGGDSRRVYYCAIVTTAVLSVCEFDPSSISLSDGTIPNPAKFKRAAAVRFTKQLSTRPADILHSLAGVTYGSEAAHVADAKERTVFLINAPSVHEFLEKFCVDDREKFP